MDKIRNVFLK